MAVGKGSILRAGSANAAAKEKKTAQENAVGKENALPAEVMKESVARVPVEALKNVPKTWGTTVLDDGKLTVLTKSIKEYGVLVPIIVYQNKKQELLILDGAYRAAAAKAAGVLLLPVSFVEAETDAEAKEIYRELRSFKQTDKMDRDYEVVSSITANLPSYLL